MRVLGARQGQINDEGRNECLYSLLQQCEKVKPYDRYILLFLMNFFFTHTRVNISVASPTCTEVRLGSCLRHLHYSNDAAEADHVLLLGKADWIPSRFVIHPRAEMYLVITWHKIEHRQHVLQEDISQDERALVPF